MARNSSSIESDRCSRSRSRTNHPSHHQQQQQRYKSPGASIKSQPPLPQVPAKPYHQPMASRQDFLLPNAARFQHPSHARLMEQLNQSHNQHPSSSTSSDMRTPVAWALRDATLSPGMRLPPGITSSQSSHHPISHISGYDSMSLHQSSLSGQQAFHVPHQHHQQHPGSGYPFPKSHNKQLGMGRHRTSSPSATTTSSDDRDEIPIVRHPHRRPHGGDGRRSVVSRVSRLTHAPASEYAVSPAQQHHHHQHMMQPHLMPPPHHQQSMHPSYGITMGTLRSTKSVPAIALMHHHQHHQQDGCPVHGQELVRHPPTTAYSVIHGPVYGPPGHAMDRRMMSAASVMDLRSLPPGPPVHASFEKKMHSLPPVGLFHPRLMMPPPTGPSQAQQAKMMDIYGVTGNNRIPAHPSVDPVCCKGHLIVLWIILSVVTMGVISAIVLGVTMN